MKRTEAWQIGIALVLVLGVTLACKRHKKEETIISTPSTATTTEEDDDPAASATTTATGTATGTTTAGGTSTALAAAKSTFKVGDKVKVMWKGSAYDASIIGVAGGDKYKIHYAGYGAEWDETVGLDRIVGAKTGAVATATATTKSTAGTVKTGGGGGGTAADAPCPGPGITRRCSGVCVNLQTDDRNCGSCGTVCASGKHCDGHLFCRDAEGNL